MPTLAITIYPSPNIRLHRIHGFSKLSTSDRDGILEFFDSLNDKSRSKFTAQGLKCTHTLMSR